MERLVEFDKLRGVAGLGIIIVHATVHSVTYTDYVGSQYCFLVLINILFRSTVAAFFIMSGFFITQHEITSGNIQPAIYKRTKRIIPPYLIWSSIYFCIFILTKETYATHQSLVFIYVEKLATGTVTWQMWFIITLCQFYLLTLLGFGKNGHFSKRLITFAILMQLLFLLINYFAYFYPKLGSKELKVILSYFQAYDRSLFPRFIVFFIIGRWLGANYEAVIAKANKFKSLGAGILIFSICFYFVEFLLLKKFSNGRMLIPEDWTLGNQIFVIALPLWILFYNPFRGRVVSFLVWVGKLSLPIYLLHEPFGGYLIRSFYKYCALPLNNQFLLQPLFFLIVLFSIHFFVKFIGFIFGKKGTNLLFGS